MAASNLVPLVVLPQYCGMRADQEVREDPKGREACIA
jgi:hypothetical protein